MRISPFILEEVEGVLREKLGVPESTIEESLRLLRRVCLVVDPAKDMAIPELSEADNRILDCAMASDARYLVTGDRAIQQLGDVQGILIVSPTEFYETLVSGQRRTGC